MSADVLAPKVTRASAGMVMSVYDRQHVHVGLLHYELGFLLLNKIQDMMRNVNTSLIIFKTIQHVKSQLICNWKI